eukprot:1150394-Pelagomonas_calceolata.AAC.3
MPCADARSGLPPAQQHRMRGLIPLCTKSKPCSTGLVCLVSDSSAAHQRARCLLLVHLPVHPLALESPCIKNSSS